MADPFLGQIILVPYNFAPAGWAFCTGQLLPIQQNAALFSLLGTYYGGNGVSTFGLPNLQGTVPIGSGEGPGLQDYVIGETGGVQNVTLLATEMPTHTHAHQGAGTSSSATNPVGNTFGDLARTGKPYYVPAPASGSMAVMNPLALQLTGGSQAHSNMQPYLVMNYIIALRGVYPSRS